MSESPNNPHHVPRAAADAETVVKRPAPAGDHADGHGPDAINSEQLFRAGPSEADPPRIGPYRVHSRLGAGGMGIVYLATRDDDQFHKRVAIKIIKKGMDSEQIIGRFEQERQVLAALNHPNVARLLDGGLTDDHRPYFVMDHVAGLPIDEYCDKNRLNVVERLNLFRTLCQAVHHAHQNLIVHRDLKPSNVIVAPDGTPKLLDFGIAKLLNPSIATFGGEPTAAVQRLLTPEYASPEQIRGDPITTASDVYSLGVMLYELLTGRRPFEFKTRLMHEIERIVCNDDPERPSTMLTRQPHVDEPSDRESRTSPPASRPTTIEQIAKVRDARPERLRRLISGDLDNIILMSLRKEPRRRYASAEQFAEDIHRHLTGLPVIARPATLVYQFSKFVTRNRGAVAAVALIILVLAGGLVTATMLRQRAVAAEREAQQQRDFAEAMRRETSDTLFAINDSIALTASATDARDIVLKSLQQYLQAFVDQTRDHEDLTLDRAAALQRLGDLQGGRRRGNRGQRDEALETYRQSRELWNQLATERPNDPSVPTALAWLHVRVGDLHPLNSDEALAEKTQAVKIAEGIAAPDVRARGALAAALLTLGDTLRERDENERAAELFKRAQTLHEQVFREQPDDPLAERNLTVGFVRLAALKADEGDHDTALALHEKALERRRELLARSPANVMRRRDVANAHYWIGLMQDRRSEMDQSVRALEEARRIMQSLRAEDPCNARSRTDGAVYASTLAGVLENRAARAGDESDLGRAMASYGEAAGMYEESVEADASQRRILCDVYYRWAALERRLGKPADARTHLQRALQVFDMPGTPDAPDRNRVSRETIERALED